MPEYKITYFNIRGRAESCRLALALAGVPFEDCRVTSEEWQKLKPDTKFGLLPILEVDGKQYAQSRAILYYVGRKYGFYPSDVEEAFKVDEIIFTIEDAFAQAVRAFYSKEEEKEEKMKEYNEVYIPKFQGNMEKVLKENNGGNGFFVGDKISVADIAVYDYVTMTEESLKSADAFPVLKAFLDRISKVDNIKAWLDKRPVTAR